MTSADEPPRPDRPLRKGAKVEVRSGFDGSWMPGYTVESLDDDGYRLRRRVDDEILPVAFPRTEVRKERNTMWWV